MINVLYFWISTYIIIITIIIIIIIIIIHYHIYSIIYGSNLEQNHVLRACNVTSVAWLRELSEINVLHFHISNYFEGICAGLEPAC